MIISPDVYAEKLTLLGGTTQEMIDQATGLFSGPSVDLHRWAVEARQSLVSPPEDPPESLFKAIFAVLPAWGMHRMGASATRMPDFQTFAASLQSAWPDLKGLWRAGLPLTGDQWQQLERAFRAIQARATQDGSQIVSRSKVLLHLLPCLCAPIDREYTLSFFGVKTIHEYRRKTQPDYEWRLYRELHERFFHVAPTDERTRRFMERQGLFDTSAMKIVDNLILANT
ncbi:hypothetical protein [Phenylobacterium sp. 58.2.17]|uniref:hypothetical protein n=1 Tax=Phenylobacterium sp. 58.2.17 TaxID=2969306 RepID=UPI002264F57B|nr:hypothetical protein [Phenylobacterium sp. 58.2.17]MCX7586226.1 hypothetical protein [Phenylobacterium sp. 58.2.17]